jgi:hypothetical protein
MSSALPTTTWRGRAVLLSIVTGAGLILGCGSLTAPSARAWELVVDSVYWTDEQTPHDRVPVIAESSTGLRVTHNIRTSYICDAVVGNLTASRAAVTIRIVATRHEGMCYPIGGNHRWVATGTLPPGDYRVIVIHEFPNQTRGTQMLLDSIVEVR